MEAAGDVALDDVLLVRLHEGLDLGSKGRVQGEVSELGDLDADQLEELVRLVLIEKPIGACCSPLKDAPDVSLVLQSEVVLVMEIGHVHFCDRSMFLAKTCSVTIIY